MSLCSFKCSSTLLLITMSMGAAVEIFGKYWKITDVFIYATIARDNILTLGRLITKGVKRENKRKGRINFCMIKFTFKTFVALTKGQFFNKIGGINQVSAFVFLTCAVVSWPTSVLAFGNKSVALLMRSYDNPILNCSIVALMCESFSKFIFTKLFV